MSWHAFDAVDDALSGTRRFLFPLRLGRWLRLAVVVFFLGGGAGFNPGSAANVPQSISNTPGSGPGPGPGPDPTAAWSALPDPALLLAGLGGLLLLVLVFGAISSTMRFVLVDMLRTDEVGLRRWFGRRVGKGVRLLGFQLALGLLLAAPVLLGVWLFVFADVAVPSIGVAGVLAALLLLIPYFLLGSLVAGLTNQLVVPVMIADDVGVLAGWRRLWGVLRAQPWQFLLYLLARWVLTLGIGLAVGAAGLLLGGVVLAVGFALGFALIAVFGGLQALTASTAGLVAVAALTLLTFLFLLVVLLPLQIPAQSFLASYDLSVLGRADPRFALLPETGEDDGAGSDRSGRDGGDGDVGGIGGVGTGSVGTGSGGGRSDRSDGPGSTYDGSAGDDRLR